MSKQDKFKNEDCLSYQEKIIDSFENEQLSDSDPSLAEHLQQCQNCRQYLENLTVIRKKLGESPSAGLKPDNRILKNIVTYNRIKNGLKNTKPNPLWTSLRELFEYRIPVYQALSAVVVIFMVYLFLSGGIVSSGDKAILIEYSGDYEELTSSELYLVDTLSLNKPVRGQNAKEDSVLMSFIVPTM